MTPPDEKSKTEIDLGDDLIGTEYVHRPVPTELLPQPESTSELLINAKILVNEGLLEEAKKILRGILLKDPSSILAQEKLNEIQEIEIQGLLKEGDQRGKRKGYTEPSSTSDQMIRELESQLEIPHSSTSSWTLEEGWNRALEKKDPNDYLDWGIALLEMELYDEAIWCFEEAKKSSFILVQASTLGAYAKILSGKAFQAILDLDALLADETQGDGVRVELGYLMGRALEAIGRNAEAYHWYRGVLEIEDPYRDSLERMKRCGKNSS